MKIFNHIAEMPPEFKGAAYAIGNFDGIHLGHQKVIRSCVAAARARGLPAGVMSFEPPPAVFFHPQKKQYRLTLGETKAALLAELGVDFLLNLPFDKALSSMAAGDFITSLLREQLDAAAIAVGANFHFGKNRQGDVALLKDRAGIPVEIISPFCEGEMVVSSTLIRAALKAGKPQGAAQLLGRWFSLTGKVVEGKKLGRTLGFPTLNIRLAHYTDIAYGIYVTRCRVRGAWFDGVASIGVRPTIGDGLEPLLEVHLLGAALDLYHAQVEVFLLDFLRKEEKFDGVEALKAQMIKDVEETVARLPALQQIPLLWLPLNKTKEAKQ